MERHIPPGEHVAEERDVQAFVERWENSGAAERANYQLFLSELCDVIGVPHPDPATPDRGANAYVFEREVTFRHGDGHQRPGLDRPLQTRLLRPRGQAGRRGPARGGAAVRGRTRAETQAPQRRRPPRHRRLGRRPCSAPAARPSSTSAPCPPTRDARPSSSSCDVGHSHRTLRRVLLHRRHLHPLPRPRQPPHLPAPTSSARRSATACASLDRAPRRSTRPAAAPGSPARSPTGSPGSPVSLEQAGHDPQAVAGFLMRCLFTMFAEDVGLLPERRLHPPPRKPRRTPRTSFVPMVEELWDRHEHAAASPSSLRTNILQFNGGLFADATALPARPRPDRCS